MQVNLPDGMFYVTPGYCSDSGLCHRHMRCRSTRQWRTWILCFVVTRRTLSLECSSTCSDHIYKKSIYLFKKMKTTEPQTLTWCRHQTHAHKYSTEFRKSTHFSKVSLPPTATSLAKKKQTLAKIKSLILIPVVRLSQEMNFSESEKIKIFEIKDPRTKKILKRFTFLKTTSLWHHQQFRRTFQPKSKVIIL